MAFVTKLKPYPSLVEQTTRCSSMPDESVTFTPSPVNSHAVTLLTAASCTALEIAMAVIAPDDALSVDRPFSASPSIRGPPW